MRIFSLGCSLLCYGEFDLSNQGSGWDRGQKNSSVPYNRTKLETPWYHLISQQTAPNRLKCCALIAPGNGGGHRSPLLVILETKSFRRDRSRVTILGVRLEALSAAAPSLYHRRRPEPNPDQRVWCVWHWVEINPNDNRFSPDCQAHFREFFTGFFAKNRRNTQNREISSQPVDSAG